MLIDKNKLIKYKSRDLIPLECEACKNTFYTTKNNVLRVIKSRPNDFKFCNKLCEGKSKTTKIKIKCKQCNTETERVPSEINTCKYVFCSSSCSAIYNNTHKTTGYRRSKLEMWLEEQLTTLYPNLKIDFNKIDTINSELDIYIPSLKLAFELNGIFHYESIYGKEKLDRTKNNDNRKFQACLENKIELCIIDTSSQGYFKEKTSQKFLDIIIKIIDKKLADNTGVDPDAF